MRQPKQTVEMPVDGKRGKTMKLFFYPSPYRAFPKNFFGLRPKTF